MKEIFKTPLEEWTMLTNEIKAYELAIIKKRALIGKHETGLQILQNKKSQIWKKVRWPDIYMPSLANSIKAKLPEEFINYEILGPFGIRAAVGLHFFKRSMDSLQKEFGRTKGYELYFSNNNMLSCTITPVDLNLGTFDIDTGEIKEEFAEGTIGKINDMNNVTEELLTVDQVLKVMLR